MYVFVARALCNAQGGYSNTVNQSVYRITASGACQPCGTYHNAWAFPVYWSCPGCLPAATQGTTDAITGCTNFTVNNNAGSAPCWAQYYGVNLQTGNLCYVSNQGRLFTVNSLTCGQPYSLSYVNPPATCKCIAPLDIVFSMFFNAGN